MRHKRASAGPEIHQRHAALLAEHERKQVLMPRRLPLQELAIVYFPILALFTSSDAAAMARRLLILRHGQRPDEIPDPSLSAFGFQQAEHVASMLRRSGICIDAIFSSPFIRCLQTAAPLAKALGKQIRVDWGFSEVLAHEWLYHANPLPQLHFGKFQKTGEELPNVAGDLIDAGYESPIPGYPDFVGPARAGDAVQRARPIARAREALSRAMRTEPIPRTLLVVGHGASHDYVIEALAPGSLPLEHQVPFCVENVSFTTALRREDGRFCLYGFNEQIPRLLADGWQHTFQPTSRPARATDTWTVDELMWRDQTRQCAVQVLTPHAFFVPELQQVFLLDSLSGRACQVLPEEELRPSQSGVPPPLPTAWKVDYELWPGGHQLGGGAFAEVFHVRHRTSHTGYAVKVMSRSNFANRGIECQIDWEIQAMRAATLYRDQLETHVLRLLEDTQEGDFVYLLLELCEQGDLLRKQGVLSEKTVKSIARQLMLGLQVVHKLGFIHRDIKPDNLLCTADGLLRLADFGWCCRKEDRPTCLAGTLLYMAPEVLSNVCAGRCVECRNDPFPDDHGENATPNQPGSWRDQAFRARSSEVNIASPAVAAVGHALSFGFRTVRSGARLLTNYGRTTSASPLAWDLVQRMLTKDPAERISVDEALSHPWLREQTEEPIEGKVATSPLPSRRKACEEVSSPSKDKVPTPSKPRSSKPNMAYTPPVSPEVTPERTPWPQSEFLAPDEKENSRDPEVLVAGAEDAPAELADEGGEQVGFAQGPPVGEVRPCLSNRQPVSEVISLQPDLEARARPYWELKRSLGSAMENMPWNQLGEGHPNQAEQPVPSAKGLRQLSEVPEEGCKPQSGGCSSVKVPLGQLPRSPFAETGDLLTTSAPASRFNLRGVVGALPQSDKTALEMLTPRTAERNPQAGQQQPVGALNVPAMPGPRMNNWCAGDEGTARTGAGAKACFQHAICTTLYRIVR
ncbi:PEPKR2 [Symbiodinium necroappetens]|uniref:PEPKR2 protein n=1 Tax=Symbiodinium necroappetens TaxID=1628268 RepID=A0A812U4N4_9DINO|nr:PEPKR2 [Symbiodinium necroappetens]